jgi:hypothetical protein
VVATITKKICVLRFFHADPLNICQAVLALPFWRQPEVFSFLFLNQTTIRLQWEIINLQVILSWWQTILGDVWEYKTRTVLRIIYILLGFTEQKRKNFRLSTITKKICVLRFFHADPLNICQAVLALPFWRQPEVYVNDEVSKLYHQYLSQYQNRQQRVNRVHYGLICL